LLQFQTDVSSARVAKVQALGSLRQPGRVRSLPHGYDVAGDLPTSRSVALPDLQAKARPSALTPGSEKGVKRQQPDLLAKADGKVDERLREFLSRLGHKFYLAVLQRANAFL
jgi:hypothetical protein